MQFKVWGKTDVGLKRELNEDSILVDKDLGLFVVADGMGGHEGGEVASNIAVTTCKKVIGRYKNSNERVIPHNLIRECFHQASHKIYQKGRKENPELMGMGTTMVMAVLMNGVLYIGNVGDSRCYIFLNNNLWQITEDHSLVNEQIRAGIIDELGLDSVIGKNVITRSVGFEEAVQVDVFEREVSPGEQFILCSDGLCGLIDDQALENILINNIPENVVDAGIEAAKHAGGDDNISVIHIQFTA